MKFLLAFILLSSLSAMAGNTPIEISMAPTTDFVAKDYTTSNLFLLGDGFFPSPQYQDPNPSHRDLQHQVQVNYRQVYPNLGSWQNAVWGRQPGVWINAISPNEIDMDITALTGAANANTDWAFMVCAQDGACSNSVLIHVKGSTYPDLEVAATNIDLGAGLGSQIVRVNTSGLESATPILNLGGQTFWGEWDGITARFILPPEATASPFFQMATISDPYTDAVSNSFAVRVFTAPKMVSPTTLNIAETLNFGQAVQDASLAISFANMSFPSVVEWQDGATKLDITVPMDLLTNKATIKIPASSLRVGTYTANLLLINAGGVVNLPVAVNIRNIEFHPIPHPIPPVIPPVIPHP